MLSNLCQTVRKKNDNQSYTKRLSSGGWRDVVRPGYQFQDLPEARLLFSVAVDTGLEDLTGAPVPTGTTRWR